MSAVNSLLNRLQRGGLSLVAVNDNVRWEKIPPGSNLSQQKFAADVINSVEESWLQVENAEGKTASLYIIPDLNGSEIVADWAQHPSFGDTLDELIEAHQEYWEDKE